MTGTLDRIEARLTLCDEHGAPEVVLPKAIARALVEVAKAAQLIRAYDQAGGNDWWEAHAQLYAALARLEDNQ